MDVENILIDETTITVINSDGGTHTIEIESDDATLAAMADTIITMALAIVETVPEDLDFDEDDFGFDDDDDDE